MTIRPWFDRWPAFLDAQIHALEDAGIPYRIDDELRARGQLRLHVTPTVENAKLRLIVDFPSTFPYFRFEIRGDLGLKRHQHPFAHNLCLIGRGTVNWHEDDTVAQYVQDRLPLVLRAGRSESPAEVAGIEEQQAEPFADYYPYLKDAIVLIDGAPKFDPGIAIGDLVIAVPEDGDGVLRGAVVAIKDRAGKVLREADPMLAARYTGKIRARWVRRRGPIREDNPETFLRHLVSEHPELARPQWQFVRGWKLDVIGIVFGDEERYREVGDGWVFLVRGEQLKDPGRRRSGSYFARAARAGRDDLAARIPELRPLADQTIAVVGLGGIGAPTALDFARAGAGELRLLDGDIVDPGTAVRWPLGFPAAGLRKVDVLKDFIRANYPYVRVRTRHRRLGMTGSEMPSDLELLEEFLSGVSLIYDATAEVGVQHLLADFSRERGIPYVCVSSTAGAWGGLLIRLRPKETTGCWVCSQCALDDKTIPAPPADPKGGVQPAGCADPTFTGSSFDLQQIALAGVRLAVGTVCSGAEATYPNAGWDMAVLSLRNHDGQIIMPEWKTFPLNRHPSCGCSEG